MLVAASAYTIEPGETQVKLRWVGDEGISSTLLTTTSSTPIPTAYAGSQATLESSLKIHLVHCVLLLILQNLILVFTSRLSFSLETNKVSQVVNSSEYLRGVTYDSFKKKLYWSTNFQIYQSNKDGSELETVLNTTERKFTKT